MKIRRRRGASRQGQILPVFAGGLVVLFAICALVIDLGSSFMLRRQEQNAADPGALAAARYIPQGGAGRSAMWSAACFYASQNGFISQRSDNNASCVTGSTPDGSVLTVNYPPSTNAGPYAGDSKYVEVVITRKNNSFFGQIVGMGAFPVTSSAVAAFDDGSAGASSLVSLDPTSCAAAHLHGGGGGGSGGGVYIFPATGVTPGSGGFVQVNSVCGTANGGNDNCMDGSSGGLKIDGGTTVTSNTIYIAGGCVVSGGSATISAATDEQAPSVGDPLSLIRPPSPADLATRQCPSGGPTTGPTSPKTCNLSGTVTVDPGTYYGGWNIANGTTLTLNPGIYIIAGGGIKQNGGLTAASGRVLIYSTDSPVCGAGGGGSAACQGKLDFAGTAALNLRGLDKNSPCLPYGTPGCPYGGLLMWQDANASGRFTQNANIELEGTGSLYLEGTIYSATGTVIVSGNGLGTGCTPNASGQTNCTAIQVIAYQWDVGGAGVLAMPYDPSLFYDVFRKGLVK